MNLQSEILFFTELDPVGQARLLALLVHELSIEARATYGSAAEHVQDGARLRFVNEMNARLARYIEQVLVDEPGRPGPDVLLRMLLAPRADKAAERLIVSAYHRAIQGFDQHDATVTMAPR
ncbi:MAG TPA: hypothetical protein VF931_04485 [Steroidobacteraceae bacterium]